MMLSFQQSARFWTAGRVRAGCSSSPLRPIAGRACATPLRTRDAALALQAGMGTNRNYSIGSFHYSPEPIPTRADPPKEVAILGGGITGLTTAYYLAKLLPETSKITVYEASDRFGGWIHTERQRVRAQETTNGEPPFVLFEKGPKTLRSLSRSAWRADDFVFFDLIYDLAIPYRSHSFRSRYVYYPDHLVNLRPSAQGLHSMLTDEPLFDGLFSTLLRMRSARARSIHPNGPNPDLDISIADWIRRIMGSNSSKTLETLMSAMMHGIYGGSIEELSMPSVLPALWHGFYTTRALGDVLIPHPDLGVIKRVLTDRPWLSEVVEKSAPFETMTFDGGMETLTKELVDSLTRQPNVELRSGHPVTAMVYNAKTDKVLIKDKDETPKSYDKVISTLFSRTVSNIAGEHVIPSLADTRAVSIMNVNLYFSKRKVNAGAQGAGYLVPNGVHNPESVLGVFFDSDAYGPSTGEQPGSKFSVLMGGHLWDSRGDHGPLPSQDEAIDAATKALRRHLGLSSNTSPSYALATLSRNCIPQHTVGHRKRMARAHGEISKMFNNRLAVIGGSYTPVGILPSIRAGFDMARHVAEEPLDHVGDTGLAQFASDDALRILQVPADDLRATGKRVFGATRLTRFALGG